MTIERNSLGLRFKAVPEASPELFILDQRQLPDRETWIAVRDSQSMCDLIKCLAVRGAPLIGVAAVLAMVVEAYRTSDVDLRRKAWSDLRAARPTAVNLMWALDRAEKDLSNTAALLQTALNIFDEDVAMCEGMAKAGAPLLSDGDSVLTICNTGGLATVGKGTAFAVLRGAHEAGKKIHVYACETRPLLQGGRLTTWELSKCGIPHTLITDSMAASLMRDRKISSVWTGADRVSARGDFANKIGTYSLAVLAKHHGIPFYPVAPLSTVDPLCPNGSAIEIEQRDAAEVRGFVSPNASVRWAPENVSVYNPSFDVTPAELVTKIILNTGAFTAEQFRQRGT
jgi:methylthioribose-1-phosphate isomerase